MNRKRLHTLLAVLAALGAMALAPTGAMAATGADVRADCLEDGELNGSYDRSALREALSEAPSNEDEYGGDCRDIIRRQLEGLSAGGSGGDGDDRTAASREGDPTSDQFADTDADQEALDDALRTTGEDGGGNPPRDGGGNPPRVSLGGESVVPAVPAAAITTTPNELPLPVALALVSLGVLALAASTLAVRRRFPDARRVALRLARR